MILDARVLTHWMLHRSTVAKRTNGVLREVGSSILRCDVPTLHSSRSASDLLHSVGWVDAHPPNWRCHVGFQVSAKDATNVDVAFGQVAVAAFQHFKEIKAQQEQECDRLNAK